ncbi:ABC transporter ATP-binding protein [Fictibacillus phosphorivorans]|uniref:ABC transporter ATP-binding protein n=1 Tax=Fictibacillus phosphorivorans TaxID=1221500 RepID=UPI00203F5514|nr:ABC transporter ATP-binding protein [Fictibacillus phosphorivorans]MCM3718326.1 ABC transporter ATP-binding protein [Fictibacillus phosphorivorans]MCM3775950.1 ABC transporter ATP-binding protein [Fictibacillus phosphorivorans]
MTTHTLELKNLTKKIKDKTIVDDLSFSVRKGEIFGLLGPNGAGKTTTIRMIVGLISITDGDVFINGTNIRENYEKAMERVGAIVENPQLYDFMSGYKNLMQYARIMPGVTQERIDEVIQLVDLEYAIHDKVKTYSLGMRQRLGVAQALLHKPNVLILDEPTNGLDPQGIYDLRNYLRLLANNGTSVIVSSHMLGEMQMMCDRVAIIQHGKLVRIDEILNQEDETDVKVHFQIEGDVQQAKKVLSDTHSDLDVIESGNELIVQTSDLKTIAEINKQLVLAGVLVVGIQRKTKTLEERFLEMTKKGGDLNEVAVPVNE